MLIASHTGMHGAVVTLDSVLAVALTLRGADIHYALCDGVLQGCLMATYNDAMPPSLITERRLEKTYCKACFNRGTGVFRPLGLNEHRLSSYLQPGDYEFAENWARETDPETARERMLDGIPVGEHAYAGALRYYASGDLRNEPGSDAVLRRYLEGGALMCLAFARLLREFQPDTVVLHHGIYSPQGVAAQVAKKLGVRVVTWVVAYRRSCFIFSHHDTYHHTLMDEPPQIWEELTLNQTQEADLDAYLASRSGGSKDWIYFHKDPDRSFVDYAKANHIDLSKPIVSLLTNVMWDAQIHYPQNAFSSMKDWLLDSIEYFRGRPDLQAVIRVHPAETRGAIPARQKTIEEINKAYPRIPTNVHLIGPDEDISTYETAAASNAVVIYGTKMGVELTPMGIPVIVAGEAWIRNKGLTIDIRSGEHYRATLDQLPFENAREDFDVERSRRYAYHFFFRRMIPLPFLQQNDTSAMFGVHVSNANELAPGRWPGLDVICDGILNNKPFVFQAENHPSQIRGESE